MKRINIFAGFLIVELGVFVWFYWLVIRDNTTGPIADGIFCGLVLLGISANTIPGIIFIIKSYLDRSCYWGEKNHKWDETGGQMAEADWCLDEYYCPRCHYYVLVPLNTVLPDKFSIRDRQDLNPSPKRERHDYGQRSESLER